MYPSIKRRIAIREEYDEVRKSIRTKAKERKALQAEKKELSPIHVKRHLELASSMAGLTEEIEELRSAKNRILARAKFDDDAGMKAFSAKLDQAKREFNDLIERKTALAAERQDGITQYEDVYERIQPGDEEAVKTERQRLRAESESRISETVSEIYREHFDPKLLSDTTKETDFGLIIDKRVEEHRKTYKQDKERLHQQQRGTTCSPRIVSSDPEINICCRGGCGKLMTMNKNSSVKRGSSPVSCPSNLERIVFWRGYHRILCANCMLMRKLCHGGDSYLTMALTKMYNSTIPA